jgi:hypothetical protein
MAEKLEEVLLRPTSSYFNSGTGTGLKIPSQDLAEHRQYWVKQVFPQT